MVEIGHLSQIKLEEVNMNYLEVSAADNSVAE